MKEEEIRSIVRQTVQETISGLGMNVTDPHELQADFAYIRNMRKGSEYLTKRIKLTAISVVIPSFLYLAWEAFKGALR
jgi:hypothetical protein